MMNVASFWTVVLVHEWMTRTAEWTSWLYGALFLSHVSALIVGNTVLDVVLPNRKV